MTGRPKMASSTDGRRTWILRRRPPLGTLTPSAHDMAREYRVVAGLYGSAVPVAAPVTLIGPEVTGVPCSVVSFVPGVVLRSERDLAELSAADVHRCAFALVDILAALHGVVPAEVGLADLGRPIGFLHRQIRRWYGQWERVRTRALPDLDALHAELVERCPGESDVAVVHGDFRIDNAIVDPADPAVVRAVVDWEMATLGDPLADLGLHLAYTDPAFAPVLGGSARTWCCATSPRPRPGQDGPESAWPRRRSTCTTCGRSAASATRQRTCRASSGATPRDTTPRAIRWWFTP